MTALELINLINSLLFIGLAAVGLRHAMRQPSRATRNTALLFGAIAAVVLLGRLATWMGSGDDPFVTALLLVLLNIVPLAMLRLVDDFRGTPRWVQAAGLVAFVGVSALAVVAFQTTSQLVELVTLVFFAAVGGYAAIVFFLESRRTRGITRRRMTAVASGAGLFIGAIVVLFIGALVPSLADPLGIVAQLGALVAVIAFFLGFAPPAWVRRAWREPDLRRFLERSAHLASVPDEREALTELQAAAAAAFGASGASVGLADHERHVIRYPSRNGGWVEHPDDAFIAGRAFSEQRRLIVPDAERADPERADAYRAAGARTVIAAPVTTEDRRIGVLSVYADRSPIFVEDDFWLLELLADQAAVLLEARTLAAHASELRGREEAARMKEEFLSAAAHDLRTPLTVVLGQAELLERRLARDPAALIDAASIGRIAREARRLRDLVSELLDAQRLEQGRAVMDLVPADLNVIADAVRERHLPGGSASRMADHEAPIVALVDRARIEQVIENLVDNAGKYGAPGRAPDLDLRVEDGQARFTVVDHGIGVPEAERERIFERFYRASNAQSITDTGLGLGLAICRHVVEEHGGRIWHEPTPGGGSTFVVTLPLAADPAGEVGGEIAAPSGWGSSVPEEAGA
ncbi:MAG TPA: ATP-binding protein [Candidatus Limnocylindria bacterium]